MMFWGLIFCFLLLITLAVVVYCLPTEKPASRKKLKKERERDRSPAAADPAKPGADKDWKAIAERWERNNNAYLGDIEKLKMQQKEMAKDLEEQKAQNKELLDKLSLEKGWREKEQVNLDKVKHHEKDLKEQIVRTEKDLEREHGERLRLERELQELKIKHDSVVEERRTATTKAASLETTVSQQAAEIRDLRRDNSELKRRRNDIQWVAKTEFDELKRQHEDVVQAYKSLKERQPSS